MRLLHKVVLEHGLPRTITARDVERQRQKQKREILARHFSLR